MNVEAVSRWIPSPLQRAGALLLIVVLAAWLRLPAISSGMPFFYHEDESHHFNRIVEMVKEGRLDPLYFHKPSLHFYLRMPMVAVGYLWGVKSGHLRSVQEIETRNPFGLGKYAFAVSHPGIVKWNRGFSVALGIGTILLVYLITQRLVRNPLFALMSALLAALAPEFIQLSGVIGVDIVMTFMAALTCWLALVWFQEHRSSRPIFFLVALLAGLTVSSKYNALPIMALPLFLAFLTRKENSNLLLPACLVPWIGFFLGSPYILIHIPLFLDQLGYEIWHYGVAGHVGNMAQPGLEQVLFYGAWLGRDGIGWLALGLSLLGITTCFGGGWRSGNPEVRDRTIALLFPLLFAALMCAQKANFTRNMMVILPFASIAAALGLEKLMRWRHVPRILSVTLGAMAILLLLPRTLEVRADLAAQPESRLEVLSMIRAELSSATTNDPNRPDTAIAGQLQFPSWVYRSPGVLRFSEETVSPLDLYLDGYDRIIVRSDAYRSARGALLDVEREIPGDSGAQRVVRNPAIAVLTFRNGPELSTALASYLTGPDLQIVRCTLDPASSGSADACRINDQPNSEAEPYPWLTRRWTKLEPLVAEVPEQGSALVLSVRTPWQNQELEVITPSARHLFSFTGTEINSWRELVVPLRSLDEVRQGLLIRIRTIHAPKARGLGEDHRRLGLALRSARLLATP